jgi:hypothetical protein
MTEDEIAMVSISSPNKIIDSLMIPEEESDDV